MQDWIDDLKAAVSTHLPHGLEHGCGSECKVAVGFLEATQSMCKGVEAAVVKVLSIHVDARVVVTGHSLGAAMASLLLANGTVCSGLDGQDQITFGHLVDLPVYTFGQPRVGNNHYAEWMTRHLFPSGEWYRVVHHDDPVPHLPTPLMGYQHQSGEVWYSESGIGRGQYEVCDGSGEDQQCSSGTMLSAEITDHLTYLTHPIHDCVNPDFPPLGD